MGTLLLEWPTSYPYPMRIPFVADVQHHCGIAPDWGPPHTVAICFTQATATAAGWRLHGIRCDGSSILIVVNDDGEIVDRGNC